MEGIRVSPSELQNQEMPYQQLQEGIMPLLPHLEIATNNRPRTAQPHVQIRASKPPRLGHLQIRHVNLIFIPGTPASPRRTSHPHSNKTLCFSQAPKKSNSEKP